MDALEKYILPAFPERLSLALDRMAESHDRLKERISELRVRAGRFASLTLEGSSFARGDRRRASFLLPRLSLCPCRRAK